MQHLAHQFDREAAIGFLLSRIDYERTSAVPYGRRDFELDRMRALLARLGDPQTTLPIVHIAGTKGKGSTAAMIAAILTAAGYRTGLYTSPHLERVEERIVVDGQPCSAAELAGLTRRVRPAVLALDEAAAAADEGTHGPTYFEILTALALVHFADRQVDIAVLEVGLGGRLDSTNACQSIVSVITSISFDHTRQLGNTLSAIAGEKAGIIKRHVPVVSGVVDDEPRQVIAAAAQRHASPLACLGVDFDFTYHRPEHLETAAACGHIDFRCRVGGQVQEMRRVALQLIGFHQGANAAVALATVDVLRRQGWQISEEAARRSLAQVSWPARVEVLRRRPTIVLDAAHNVASVAAFLRVLEECFAPSRRLLVFATTRDKDVRGMLRLVLPKFDQVIFTRYLNNPRGVPPEELDALAAEWSDSPRWICADPLAAWRQACALARADCLIGITGSFFIAAEMRAAIGNVPLEVCR
jgi:dihydrofolate synthase/folylpolyglutamate synthase